MYTRRHILAQSLQYYWAQMITLNLRRKGGRSIEPPPQTTPSLLHVLYCHYVKFGHISDRMVNFERVKAILEGYIKDELYSNVSDGNAEFLV